jgi:hypothetical protein
MRAARYVVGTFVAAVLAWTNINNWVLSPLLAGVPDSEVTQLQRALLPAVQFTERYLAWPITACLITLPLLFLLWVVRTPRTLPSRDLSELTSDLSTWLAWSCLIAVVAYASIIATSIFQVRGWHSLMLLVLPFGATYAMSMFRALQIQAYRRDRGLTRVSPSLIALAGIVPMGVLPLWPLGLVAFGAVLRYARPAAE